MVVNLVLMGVGCFWVGFGVEGGDDDGGGLAGCGDGLLMGDAVSSVISSYGNHNLLSIIYCYLFMSNISLVQSFRV